MTVIAHNLELIKGQLPDGVRLVAVSKTQPPERIMEAYEAGQRIFGENRVQELLAKHDVLPEDIRWHLIGHLQTNKVKQIVPVVEMIHSIDSEKLMSAISKSALSMGKVVDGLLQVHIAQEETKFGLDEQELNSILDGCCAGRYAGVAVHGLMGMATFTDDQDQVRKEFKYLKNLFLSVKDKHFAADDRFAEISMGMSSDYLLAVEEGSTLVRIGTSIFGKR
ncbi:MAG: YggS family pyridoxal phosphate-dependent enzyme [Bacteroidales bacterium]|nr:YggS family pyridoxal phosphate-dependent enzyme [Bacteroidales bacterium]